MVVLSVAEQQLLRDGLHGSLPPVLPVGGVLKELFPEGGLRRGGVFSLGTGSATTSLLFALLGSALADGSWGAALGMASFGVEAAHGYEVPLARLLLVPSLGSKWLETTAAMLAACDVVVLCPPHRCSAQAARQLAARTRVQGAVLLIVPPPMLSESSRTSWQWPVATDGRIDVVAAQWCGLGTGEGTLLARHVELRFSGRGAGHRPRGLHCWLPNPLGAIVRATPTEAAIDLVVMDDEAPFVQRLRG